jgi:hypothetical protein
VICHFLLLWVADPIRVLQEMKRIARNNSSILVLAEPDYSGRLDYPDELIRLGTAQTDSLINQGANPFIGRLLGGLFRSAGIALMEMGIMGGQWHPVQYEELKDDEWKMISYDQKFLPEQAGSASITQIEVNNLRKIHEEALRTGERVLFVPTFYAWGKVKK